ncbi:hypothetical protein CDAR_583201 [Caerostris darwini]|uniref:Uncharacterized protein n=1 Tax=Caerostris darwini TaxID=1538125 RepID=A0AAV4SRU4_9ARAC|nr:hypothetical protein CDAR_583201 [Caerostris darwini]
MTNQLADGRSTVIRSACRPQKPLHQYDEEEQYASRMTFRGVYSSWPHLSARIMCKVNLEYIAIEHVHAQLGLIIIPSVSSERMSKDWWMSRCSSPFQSSSLVSQREE